LCTKSQCPKQRHLVFHGVPRKERKNYARNRRVQSNVIFFFTADPRKERQKSARNRSVQSNVIFFKRTQKICTKSQCPKQRNGFFSRRIREKNAKKYGFCVKTAKATKQPRGASKRPRVKTAKGCVETAKQCDKTAKRCDETAKPCDKTAKKGASKRPKQ
ncbi:MAG: hypothetical protein GY820_48640, partial [Gammaproteobacteria bacterium]|nr:hypothetical protein [Gammaproteobacteria bacterium]